ncbi:MAG TPA: 1-phosphofructokinase [Cellulomonas sp.]
MIVTVTLNPSLDRTVELDRLVRGQVLRAGSTHLDPGGKGVNVTRALLANGVPSRAVLPVAGADGQQLVDLLEAEGVATELVRVAGRTRSNIAIAEADGTVTKVNEPGTALTAGELDEVLGHALHLGTSGDWVVLCGSLPPGVPADTYARMVRRLRAAGLRVAVDSSGPPLAHAIDAGPDLAKPNASELAEVAGHALTCRQDVVDAAREVQRRGVGRVLVSLGADGALLVDGPRVVSGRSPVTDPRSTVGAGDALLAGFLAATLAGADDAAALGAGLAWGSAAVRLPGSRMPGPADVAEARVELDEDPSDPSRLSAPLDEAVPAPEAAAPVASAPAAAPISAPTSADHPPAAEPVPATAPAASV